MRIRYSPYTIGMTCKDVDCRPGLHIPQPRCPIIAASKDICAVRGECHATYHIRVTCERANLGACPSLPHPSSVISVAARGAAANEEISPIRRECNTTHRVSCEATHLLTSLHLPESCRLVRAAGQHIPAIRRVRHSP